MANIYRERAIFDTEGRNPREVRCSVYVLSATAGYTNTGQWQQRALSISAPTTAQSNLEGATHLTWRGDRYMVQVKPWPIVALGRIDHYELTASKYDG